MKATVIGKYDQVEFSPDYPPIAFQINSMGTGIGRACAWVTALTMPQYQTAAFTITNTDRASNP